MPSINLQISPHGPLIDVYIGVSLPREKALLQANQPIPTPVPARILIDTGASNTCLDESILGKLNLPPTGIISAHTPSTQGVPMQMSQYDIKLTIHHPQLSKHFTAVAVTSCQLSAQGIQGLLGRDILSSCLLIYNGEAEFYTLSF